MSPESVRFEHHPAQEYEVIVVELAPSNIAKVIAFLSGVN